jgi:hypothetical protein
MNVATNVRDLSPAESGVDAEFTFHEIKLVIRRPVLRS